MSRHRLLFACALGLVLAILATTASSAATEPRKKGPQAQRLKAFRSCAGIVRYGNRYVKRVGYRRAPAPVFGAPGPTDDGAAAPDAGGAAPDFSGTNVQEAGVDEPDIVKTNGRTIFAVAYDKLHAVDARAASPTLLGSLDLGDEAGYQLLLRGNRVLVTWTDYSYAGGNRGGGADPVASPASSIPSWGMPTTHLAEVDVSDPAAMRLVRTLEVDGNFVSARLNGSRARLVFTASPPALTLPLANSGPRPARTAARSLPAARRVSSWVPRLTIENERTGVKKRRPVARCRSIRHTASFSGLDLLTVLTIDLDQGLAPIDRDALMTTAETVYGSNDGLYVATQRYGTGPVDPTGGGDAPRETTELHKFDISDPTRTVYRGSGAVVGHLLNQFSLSEHRGVLRAATTTEPSFEGIGGERDGQSFVTTLTERSGRLEQLGRVGGLGRGERIYAVRFIEDVGYVVTFRQTDPLYTLDLAEPTQPKVLGELKIRGYSAYLHPAGDDLLIGIGQDATEEGRTQGAQVSLFDVSDLRKPVRLHQRALGSNTSSTVEYDHRAFLYWAPTRLAVLPVQAYNDGPKGSYFSGAMGFRLGRQSGIDKVGEVSHEDDGRYSSGITRSLVVGDKLFTLSNGGLKASALDSLAASGFAAFPPPPERDYPPPGEAPPPGSAGP